MFRPRLKGGFDLDLDTLIVLRLVLHPIGSRIVQDARQGKSLEGH